MFPIHSLICISNKASLTELAVGSRKSAVHVASRNAPGTVPAASPLHLLLIYHCADTFVCEDLQQD
jgi:hypothetical protein